MSTSNVLAQILGIMFAVLGLSLLLNKKATVKLVDEMFQNKALIWLGGLIALLMGATMVVINNIWTSGLPLFVTLLGWLTLIKGIFILVLPNPSFAFYKKMNKENTYLWAGIIIFILGIKLLL